MVPSRLKRTNMASPYKGPLRHRCAYCSTTIGALTLCSGCPAIRYCTEDHQLAHRPQHAEMCGRTGRARIGLATAERTLRHAGPDSTDLLDPTNGFVGHFWSLYNTGQYMRTRQELACTCLAKIGTLDSLEEALEHRLEMPKLQGHDIFRLRHTIPSLLPRLDRDQECRKFIGCRPRGLDKVKPYLLLELKQLVDIRKLKIARQILALRRIPFDIGELIEPAVIRSPLSDSFHTESSDTLRKTETRLVNFIRQLGTRLHEINGEYMSSLFDPARASRLDVSPQVDQHLWEAASVMAYNTDAAWCEAEGVLDLLRCARACAAEGSGDEIREKLERGVFGPYEGSQQRFNEVIACVSVDRIWAYLDWVVEDASYLRPRSERPSVKHLRDARRARANAKADALIRNSEGSWSTSDDDAGWLYNIDLFYGRVGH
jgi:hypothetical protein